MCAHSSSRNSDVMDFESRAPVTGTALLLPSDEVSPVSIVAEAADLSVSRDGVDADSSTVVAVHSSLTVSEDVTIKSCLRESEGFWRARISSMRIEL